MGKRIDVIWERIDLPGHDACTIERADDGWQISGMAVWAEDGTVSRMSYRVTLAPDWATRSARVAGVSGGRDILLDLWRDAQGLWWSGSVQIVSVSGCLDVDLGFTPATNTNALRRMALELGAAVETTAAWLDTSDWQIKPLTQHYRRMDDTHYRYRSPSHGYEATLTTDENSVITDYPELWRSAGPTQ